ncbi:MAG: hypothetical protein QOH12_3531 [Solirubrobacteraceae bacterium]|nr:hypothetical protein [Solirubrobacteraceae bacterium]
MTINLSSTNLDITDPDLQGMFADLQGNILKSHGRDLSRHVFLRFGPDAAAARTWVRAFADQVTSAAQQHADALDWKATGREHLFTSLMLTAAGYRALGVDESLIPDEKAFRAGMKDLEVKYNTAPRGDHVPTANPLNDDPTDWEDAFQEEIHALVVIAYGADGLGDDDALAALTEAAERLQAGVAGGVAEVMCVQHGHVLRNARDQVIEHFGYTDGVSDPLCLKHDLDRAFANGGFEHFDPAINLGGVLVADPAGGRDAHGTYVVYRKLQQNIRGFASRTAEFAAALSQAAGAQVGPDLAGALAVGRFKDGTPVGEQACPGWENEFNNFDYTDDATGLRCPLASHVRRSNPRGDTYRRFGSPLTIERSRRIVRRGISYGAPDLDPPEEWTDAGLLFICCQSNIEDQFIFIQHTWCNNQDFLNKGVGVDPVVGQPPPGVARVPQAWPSAWGRPLTQIEFDMGGFIRTRGGEYFFCPSLSALRSL